MRSPKTSTLTAVTVALLNLFPLAFGLLPMPAASPPSNVATSIERNETETAFDLFSLYLTGEYEDGWRQSKNEKDLIFKNGNVQDHWLPPSAVEGVSNSSVDHLFSHDQFTDRISFEFFFGSFASYDITKPTCTVSDTSVARPKVLEFQMDMEEHSGFFSIVYDCHKHQTSSELKNVTVSVVVPVVTGLSLIFSFRKTCGGGYHSLLEFGHYEESQNAATEVSRLPFSKRKTPLLVGPHVVSTKLYLHLHRPAGSQEFFHIDANASSDVLALSTRGPMFGGVLRPSEFAIIHILYECHGNGEVAVSVRIPVYPFHDLTASWVKDCGGGVAEGLKIGSSSTVVDDIVSKGHTSENWLLALQTNSAHIEPVAPVINSSVRWKDFWLSNDGIPVHVAPAIVTLEKPGILTAILTPTSAAKRSLFTPQNGGLLPTDASTRLRLQLICTRKGRSLVVVTLPIKSFSNIEFGFVKTCRAPNRHVHSGFLRTANSVMVTVSLFITAALGYWWKLKSQRENDVLSKKPVHTLLSP